MKRPKEHLLEKEYPKLKKKKIPRIKNNLWKGIKNLNSKTNYKLKKMIIILRIITPSNKTWIQIKNQPLYHPKKIL